MSFTCNVCAKEFASLYLLRQHISMSCGPAGNPVLHDMAVAAQAASAEQGEAQLALQEVRLLAQSEALNAHTAAVIMLAHLRVAFRATSGLIASVKSFVRERLDGAKSFLRDAWAAARGNLSVTQLMAHYDRAVLISETGGQRRWPAGQETAYHESNVFEQDLPFIAPVARTIGTPTTIKGKTVSRVVADMPLPAVLQRLITHFPRVWDQIKASVLRMRLRRQGQDEGEPLVSALDGRVALGHPLAHLADEDVAGLLGPVYLELYFDGVQLDDPLKPGGTSVMMVYWTCLNLEPGTRRLEPFIQLMTIALEDDVKALGFGAVIGNPTDEASPSRASHQLDEGIWLNVPAAPGTHGPTERILIRGAIIMGTSDSPAGGEAAGRKTTMGPNVIQPCRACNAIQAGFGTPIGIRKTCEMLDYHQIPEGFGSGSATSL